MSEPIEPTIRPTAWGTWLATTPAGCSPRIGVIGATEIEARREYAASLRQWQRIAALPDPPWAYRWPLVGPEPTSTDGGEQQ